jgi:hypothetical protein
MRRAIAVGATSMLDARPTDVQCVLTRGSIFMRSAPFAVSAKPQSQGGGADAVGPPAKPANQKPIEPCCFAAKCARMPELGIFRAFLDVGQAAPVAPRSDGYSSKLAADVISVALCAAINDLTSLVPRH